MITSPDGAWRIVTPPKTGSTSLQALFRGPPFNAEISEDQHVALPLEGAKMMGSVRNPFSRLVSLWRHRRYEVARSRGQKGKPLTEEELPFGVFVRSLQELKPFYSLPIVALWRDCEPISVILRLENILADLHSAFPEWEGDEVPHLNDTHLAPYSAPPYRESWCRDFVRGWAREDFARFDYSRQCPEELM